MKESLWLMLVPIIIFLTPFMVLYLYRSCEKPFRVRVSKDYWIIECRTSFWLGDWESVAKSTSEGEIKRKARSLLLADKDLSKATPVSGNTGRNYTSPRSANPISSARMRITLGRSRCCKAHSPFWPHAGRAATVAPTLPSEMRPVCGRSYGVQHPSVLRFSKAHRSAVLSIRD